MIRDWGICAGLFLLALTLNLGAVATSPFHPDETRWLNRAHYLRDLADPFGSTWEDGYLTRGQPPLGSYLMGLGLVAQGHDLQTNGVWSFWHDAAWNRARGNMASPADLDAGRRTNAVVGALAVAVVYLAGRRLTNRVGGLAGGLLLAAHPLMITLASQALSDALMVLALAAAVLAGCRLAERPSWPPALALGAALGLGGATKLSPLLIALPLAGLGAVLLIRSWRSRQDTAGSDSRLGWRLLAMPVIAMSVFVAVYPYLWPDPIRRSIGLFTFRVEEMARQGDNWAGVAVASRAEALWRIGDRLAQDYSGPGQVAGWLTGADLALGIAGLVLLAGMALTVQADRRYPVTLAILGSQAGLIVLGLRSDYARYSLPIVLVLAFGVSIAAGSGGAALAREPRRQWPRLRRRGRQVVATPVFSSLAWTAAGAGVVLALVGTGSVRGDDLPEIVALPATPRAAATPMGAATPVAATPGATPLADPAAATPLASPRATPV